MIERDRATCDQASDTQFQQAALTAFPSQAFATERASSASMALLARRASSASAGEAGAVAATWGTEQAPPATELAVASQARRAVGVVQARAHFQNHTCSDHAVVNCDPACY